MIPVKIAIQLKQRTVVHAASSPVRPLLIRSPVSMTFTVAEAGITTGIVHALDIDAAHR